MVKFTPTHLTLRSPGPQQDCYDDAPSRNETQNSDRNDFRHARTRPCRVPGESQCKCKVIEHLIAASYP